MNYSVVIPCAGKGSRMGLDENKIFLPLNGKSIIEHTVNIFLEDERCKQIILVHSQEDEKKIKEIFSTYKLFFTLGGKERTDSVYAGLKLVSEDVVLIHDGARPFVTKDCINNVLNALDTHVGAICGVPVKDTIKVVDKGVIISTPPRETLWQAQTPQGFKTAILLGILCVTGIYMSIYANNNYLKTRYEAIIDQSVSYMELTEKYNVIEQRGEIFVLEEKFP